MPITTDFIALWFTASALSFGLLTGSFRTFISEEQPDRDLNTFLIIFSQGLGALAAYALH